MIQYLYNKKNMRQKRVLMISLEFPPQIGGIATFLHQLTNALDHQRTVLLAPEMEGDKEWDTTHVTYPVIRKKMLYDFFWPRWLKLFFEVRKIVKKENIELIILHHVLPVGYAAWMIKKLYGVPFIIFSHGTDVVASTSTSWKRRMVKMLLKETEQVIFNSHNLLGRLDKKLPSFHDKYSVLYPCPDAEFFTPENKEAVEDLRIKLALEGKKVVLTVGRIDNGKGFRHMAQIFPKLLEKEPDLVWIIIGDGPLQKEMYDTIRKNNLQNIVRYVGEIPHDQIKKYYYLCDVFAMFSHPWNGLEEGLGLVFLEAAACGAPIVAGRSGGVVEAVLDGETGIIVDVLEKTEEAGDTILKLIEDKELAQKLGNAGQERMKKSFIWEYQLKVLDKWLLSDD